MQRLAFKLETIVTESVRTAHFDAANAEHGIGTAEGLNFAFGLTAYDGNRTITEDPRYGQTKAKIVSWGFSDTNEIDATGGIPTHICSEEELGIVEGDSKFFPIHENSLRDTKMVSQKLQCLDKDFRLQGDYNSAYAKILKLTFEICDRSVEENDCAPEEEIRDWLKRKFLVVLMNQERFQQTIGEDMIKQESKLVWYPIESTRRVEFANNV